MVLNNALAPITLRHLSVDVSSFPCASFAMATSAAGYVALPPLSVDSTSKSDNPKIGGGGVAPLLGTSPQV